MESNNISCYVKWNNVIYQTHIEGMRQANSLATNKISCYLVISEITWNVKSGQEIGDIRRLRLGFYQISSI